MSDVTVREGRAEDASSIVAFNLAMARESQELELAPTTLLAGVEKALADRSRGRYLVAEVGAEVVGCLLVTREWSDWRDGWYWWIQSVYVAPEQRGRGVYAALHERVRTEARAAGNVVALRLYVERGNERAQRVYRRPGMSDSSYVVYEEIFDR